MRRGLRVGAERDKPLQHRQREAGRLAGARLGAGEHVAALRDDGDDARLNRRGLGVALLRDATQ